MDHQESSWQPSHYNHQINLGESTPSTATSSNNSGINLISSTDYANLASNFQSSNQGCLINDHASILMSTGGLTNLLAAAAAPAIRDHDHAYNLISCLHAGNDSNTNSDPNHHNQDAANAADLQVANSMQAMTVQSLREIMGIGASYGNPSLANDHINIISTADVADDQHEQFGMINQAHTFQDGLMMDPKSSLGSFMYSNFSTIGDDSHTTAGGAAAGTAIITATRDGTQATTNSSKNVDHSPLILQSFRSQALYNSASEMMMSASTDQRIPYRTQLQRESHILAERQRREEMNEKFTILRSMIPKLTKKDKASIVTDTINYIKELEKKVSYLQSCKGKNATKAQPHLNTSQGVSKRRPEGPLEGASNREKGLNTLEARPPSIRDAILIKADHHQESAFLSINAEPFIQHEGHGDHDPRRVKIGQVEIENLGDQAVIKVLSLRDRGVVLRLHLALEECKVDVIQSNVTTVGNNMVHFVTVGLHPGISTNINDLAAALQIAATSNNVENVEFI